MRFVAAMAMCVPLLAAAQSPQIHRCVGADQRVTLQQHPCNAARGQEEMTRTAARSAQRLAVDGSPTAGLAAQPGPTGTVPPTAGGRTATR